MGIGSLCSFRLRRIAIVSSLCFALLVAADTTLAQAKSFNWPLAKIPYPESLVIDTTKNSPSVVVASWITGQIFRIEGPNRVRVVAGIEQPGFSGDAEMDALKAQFDGSVGVAVTKTGEIVFADSNNHRIRMISADEKTVKTIAGSGPTGRGNTKRFAGDGGRAINARLDRPRGVTVLPTGEIVFTDAGNHRVRMIDQKGIITTIAGNGSIKPNGETGMAIKSSVPYPTGVTATPQGDLLVAEFDANRIRKISMKTGTIETVCGGGSDYHIPVKGRSAREIALHGPRTISLHPNGGYFIADSITQRVVLVGPDGIARHIAGERFAPGSKPSRVDDEFQNSGGWIDDTDIDSMGKVSSLADATMEHITDPFEIDMMFHEGREYPYSLRDYNIQPSHYQDAGYKGDFGLYWGDGREAGQAKLSIPLGVVSTPDGGVLISDFGRGLIRFVGPEGSDDLLGKQAQDAVTAYKRRNDSRLRKILAQLKATEENPTSPPPGVTWPNGRRASPRTTTYFNKDRSPWLLSWRAGMARNWIQDSIPNFTTVFGSR